MITRAVLRYVRISPRKFRLIIPLIKGKRPEEAIAILSGVKKGASKYGIDLLQSALNNARRKQGVNVAELYVSNLVASGGPMLKRFRAGSMGRASMIKKRTSHITLELDLLPATGEGGVKGTAKADEKHLKAKSVKHTEKAVPAAVKKDAVKAVKKAKVKDSAKTGSEKKDKE